MPRTTYRQSDIKRALKACTAAGVQPERAEFDPNGKLVIFFKNDTDALELDDPEGNALIDWRRKHGLR
jgi:hypothetical protein